MSVYAREQRHVVLPRNGLPNRRQQIKIHIGCSNQVLRHRAMAGVGMRALPLRQGTGAFRSCRSVTNQSSRRTRCQCESSSSSSDTEPKKRRDIKSTIGNIDSLLGIEEDKKVRIIQPGAGRACTSTASQAESDGVATVQLIVTDHLWHPVCVEPATVLCRVLYLVSHKYAAWHGKDMHASSLF